MEKINIVEVPIGDLKPASYNPRKWTEKAIKDITESVKKFGLVDPIIVNSAPERMNIVVGGHFRLKVAGDLGYITVPVVYVNIPNEQTERELNLRLNKNLGAWDFDSLASFGEDLLKIVGFETDELDKIFQITEEDDFDLSEALGVVAEPKAKYGDIYQLGKHRLMCGDATKKEDVTKLMAGKEAQMVFTDPPYNVDYQGSMNSGGQNLREGIQNDKMSAEDFRKFLDSSIGNMLSVCPGVFYICMSSKELAALKDVFEKNGGHWQSFIIWAKNTFTLSRSDWQNQYEPILYGWNAKTVNHYFAGFRDEGNVWENLEKLKPEFDGTKTTIKVGEYHLELDGEVKGRVCQKKNCVDVWREKKPSKSKERPTMKPIKLVAKAIKASSERGQIVLDLFGGSGSTLIAADMNERVCYMMELDPKYIDVIIARWEKLTGEQAIKIEN